MGRGFLRAVTCVAALGLVACSDDTSGPTPDGPRKPDGGRDFKTEQRPPSDARVDFYVPPDTGPIPDGLTCKLTIESINKKPVFAISQLSSLDDQDKATPGIQLDVVVSVIGKPDGTPVTLQVTGLQPSPVANSAAGKASFTGVTLAPGLTGVTMRAEATDCVGTPSIFSVQLDPSCSFTSPTDGAKLTAVNDKIPGNGTFDYDVNIQTQNAAGATVTLFVAGTAVGTPKTPDLSGLVSFPGEALSTGPSVELKATVSAGFLSAECTITISIDNSKPTCDLGGFNPPAKLTSKGVPALGPAQDAEPATPKLQTTITVDTSAGVDQVILDLDGVTQTATPDTVTHKATFKLTLEEGTRAVQATCKNSTASVEAQSPKTSVLVDTTPPPAPTDLACTVTNHRAGEISCTWKSVSDGANGSGVEKYQVRYRTNSAISAANFDATDTTKPADQPAVPAGSTQPWTLKGLKMPNTYAEAVKAVDYVGNVSALSNLPAGQKVDFKVQQIDGQAPGQFLGSNIAVGDFNCDGYTDVAVGIPGANGNLGQVQLYFSQGVTFPSSPSKFINGTQASGGFGGTLLALNYNGDTSPCGGTKQCPCTDLAVRGLKPDQGRAFLFLGAPVWADREDVTTGKGAELIFQLPASAGSTERLAQRLGVADLNGDGRDDLVLTHWITDGAKWSSLLVKYGETNVTKMSAGLAPATREVPTIADIQVTGGNLADQFAYIMRRGGLLNADTYEELLVSAANTVIGGKQTGSAYVLLGKATAATSPPELVDLTTSSRVLRIDGGSANVAFGVGIAGVGDINGDGTPEFIIGDFKRPSATNTGVGEAYLFSLGGATPKTANDAKAIVTNDIPDATDNWFGNNLANGADIHPSKGADLNTDGIADFVIGGWRTGAQQHGSARLYYGTSGALANLKATIANYVFLPGAGGTISFSANSIMSDVNGDGYPDLAVSEAYFNSNAGRIVIYY
jgi:hypothetical protein